MMAQTWTIMRITNSAYAGAGSTLAALFQNSQLSQTFQPGMVNQNLPLGYEVRSGSYGVGIIGSDNTMVRLGSNSTALFDATSQRLVVEGEIVMVGAAPFTQTGVVEARYTCNQQGAAVYTKTDSGAYSETYYALSGQTRVYDFLPNVGGQPIADVLINEGSKQTIQNINNVHQFGTATVIPAADFTAIGQLLAGFWTVVGGRKADNILPTSPITSTYLHAYLA